MITKIKEARKAAGYTTQELFAQAIGVPRSTLAKWETGLATPSVGTLSVIAHKLNCTVDDLLAKDSAQN